ncbi:MAG: hypothetical protein WBG15_22885 [Xanthobacteraceae bacterium]
MTGIAQRIAPTAVAAQKSAAFLRNFNRIASDLGVVMFQLLFIASPAKYVL